MRVLVGEGSWGVRVLGGEGPGGWGSWWVGVPGGPSPAGLRLGSEPSDQRCVITSSSADCSSSLLMVFFLAVYKHGYNNNDEGLHDCVWCST